MPQLRRALSLFLVSTFLTPLLAEGIFTSHARAEDIVTIVIKKEEEKRKTRWNLSEWIETRDKMRLMDLWLAIHSPSPYEFFISPEALFPQTGTGSSTLNPALRLQGAAYASIVGLQAQHSFLETSETKAQVNLRLLGYHVQSTNITLHGGLRFRDQPGSTRNGYAGAELTLYLGRFAGVQGLYQYHFSPVSNTAGNNATGTEWETQGFIDFKALRVFAGYQSLSEQGSGAQNRSSWLSGLKLFF